MQKQIEKMFFVTGINVSELAVLYCLYYEVNTCHRQSICWETFLRLSMSLREAFSNWIAFIVINESSKGGAVQISTVFGHP